MITIISAIVLGALMLHCSIRSFHAVVRTQSDKRRAKKLLSYGLLMAITLIVSYQQYNYVNTYYDQYENEVQVMDEKFSSIEYYEFYNWAEDVMYKVPQPLPEEFPFTIEKVTSTGTPETVTINSYEDMPIVLDNVWYWYGTQGLAVESDTAPYYAFTHGTILSKPAKNMEQQVFTFAGEDAMLQNVYIVNFPYDNVSYTWTADIWQVIVWAAAIGICINFVLSLYTTVRTIRSKKRKRA